MAVVGRSGAWESGIKLLFDVEGTSRADSISSKSWSDSLSEPKLWVAAASQVLISLHLSCGLTLTLSSRSQNHGYIFRYYNLMQHKHILIRKIFLYRIPHNNDLFDEFTGM